uniref:Uncharacterized protein n=1 Tax=Fagus sylvatica TaxID=28930 RepID=A0A2N9J892_FAGSY
MEGSKKNQSLSMSSLAKVVPLLPSPPSPWSNNIGNNHEVSGGDQSVHGEVVPLDKGFVPPSAPSSCTSGGIGNHDKMSGGKCPVGA